MVGVGTTTVTTPVSLTDIRLQAVVVVIVDIPLHHLQVTVQTITNKADMGRLHRMVVGLTVLGIMLVQPVRIDVGTVTTNMLNENLGGVKRVIILLDILLAATTAAVVTVAIAAEGINESNVSNCIYSQIIQPTLYVHM